MSLKCGIVGLPNVGKSTLFNALTKSGIAAENYPFCTIEPNVGIVEIPDERAAQIDQARSSLAGKREELAQSRPEERPVRSDGQAAAGSRVGFDGVQFAEVEADTRSL